MIVRGLHRVGQRVECTSTVRFASKRSKKLIDSVMRPCNRKNKEIRYQVPATRGPEGEGAKSYSVLLGCRRLVLAPFCSQ